MVNYIIKCDTQKKKKELIQTCGTIELRNQKFCQGNLYELSSFQHRRTLPITRILCKRKKLSGNCKTSRQESKFGVEGIATEMYVFQGYTEILSAYGAKEKQFKKQLPSPRNFLKQEVLDYIDEKLSQTWSPEQITKTPCDMKLPSFKTIYRWIDEKYLFST